MVLSTFIITMRNSQTLAGYRVSGIVFSIIDGDLKILLVRKGYDLVGLPTGEEIPADEHILEKTLLRSMREKIPSYTMLELRKWTNFFQITPEKKEKTKQPVHYFWHSGIKNKKIPFPNNEKRFWVPWREVFLRQDLDKTDLPGLISFLLLLKNQVAPTFFDEVYEKNEELHFFQQAFNFVDTTGLISIRNVTALSLLGIDQENLKLS